MGERRSPGDDERGGAEAWPPREDEGLLAPGELALLREWLPVLGGSRGQAAAESAAAVRGLDLHLRLVAEANRVQNLTAITAPREMVVKHTLDSSTVAGVVDLSDGSRVLDVGSGAGYPGIVLQILAPGARVTLLDASRKKCEFLAGVRQRLVAEGVPGAERLEVVWGRAEEKGQGPDMREQFDVVVARAVAELRVLVELLLPFCRVGGFAIAMKGPGVDEEVASAGGAVATLGGVVDRIVRVELPEQGGGRGLVVVRKVAPTPRAYPRRPGVPWKRPL